jgi:MATE family multidrug resistance protein
MIFIEKTLTLQKKMNQSDRHILEIAIPAIVTNITVPLLGLVDTAIVGHMGDAAYIGAIAVGSMIFSLVYWVFAFLRMGTSGLTAQARGRRDMEKIMRLLMR